MTPQFGTATWPGRALAAAAALLKRVRRPRTHGRHAFTDPAGRLPSPIDLALAPLPDGLVPAVPVDGRSCYEAHALAPDLQNQAARVLHRMLRQLQTGVALHPPYFLAPDTNLLIALEHHALNGNRASPAIAFRECARFLRTALPAWGPRLLVTPVVYYEFAGRTPPADVAAHKRTLGRLATLLAPLGLPIWVAGVATFDDALTACRAVEADVVSLSDALRALKAIDWAAALAVREREGWLPLVTHLVDRHVGPVATRILDPGAVRLALVAVTEQLIRKAKALPKQHARGYRYTPWEPVARLVKERPSRPLEGVGDVDLFGLHNVQHQFAADVPFTVLALTAEKNLSDALVANNNGRRIGMSFRAGESREVLDARWRVFFADHARLNAWEVARRDYVTHVVHFLETTPWLSPPE